MTAKPDITRANWRLEGTTIVVDIPMQWKRRGGRKVIIAPDGSTVSVAGRILRIRDYGGVIFAQLRDWSGEIQLLLEGLEGQQRLYISHLLRTKTPDDQLPDPPEGAQWASEKALATMDLLPGIRRLCQSALQAVKDA